MLKRNNWFTALILALMIPALASAQVTPPAAAPAAAEEADDEEEELPLPKELQGDVSAGFQYSSKPDSGKFNEYRDLDTGLVIPGFRIETFRPGSGLYVESYGSNLLRDDRSASARVGQYGKWNLGVQYYEIPHLLSTKAKSPYSHDGSGNLTVASTVRDYATSVGGTFTNHLEPSAAQLQANDALVSGYMAANVKPTELRVDRKTGKITGEYSPREDLSFRVSFLQEDQNGNETTYGPIGDRPPRTLNIQMQKPVDQKVQEAKFEADFVKEAYQIGLSYQYSKFSNAIDVLNWQNIYTPTGSAQETWATRGVATFGQRALEPDNDYQNISATVGVDLPMESHLTATAGLGMMRQNQALIPYTTSTIADTTDGGILWNSVDKLPRQTAEGAIDTRFLHVNYALSPIDRMKLRAFFRMYDMDNKTPESNWKYVTSDTVSTAATGAVSYVNKRRSVAYASDKQSFGLDGSYGLGFWNSNVGLGYEREGIKRTYREANTDEDIFKATYSARPMKGLALRTKVLYGDRKEKDFNPYAVSETYVYAPGDVNDNNDPKFAFENHPDTRQFDTSNRKRLGVSLSGTMTPTEELSLSLGIQGRHDDFDSHVSPTQPLAGYAARGGTRTVTAAGLAATTPGDQIGLLKNDLQQVTFDANYDLNEDLSLNVFAAHERIKNLQRGIEFNENNRVDPDNAGLAANELGPWTRANSQWMAETKDVTSTIGLGARWVVIEDKLTLGTSVAYALGEAELHYSGFGAQSSLDPANALADNYQFAFRTPPAVKHTRYSADVALDYTLKENMTVGVAYLYENYNVEDWMQASDTPQYESLGNDNYGRDTSRDQRWGNRLPNLGSYLAPGYVAHVGTVSVKYLF